MHDLKGQRQKNYIFFELIDLCHYKLKARNCIFATLISY